MVREGFNMLRRHLAVPVLLLSAILAAGLIYSWCLRGRDHANHDVSPPALTLPEQRDSRPPDDLRATPSSSAVIYGSVLDPQGSAVPRATICLVREEDYDLAFRTAATAEADEPNPAFPKRTATVHSDSAGRYRFDGCTFGCYRLFVSHEQYFAEVTTPLWVLPVTPRLRRDFNLSSGQTISGVVTDEAGRSLAAVRVTCSRSAGRSVEVLLGLPDTVDTLAPKTLLSEALSVLSRPDGTFATGCLSPQRYDILLTKPGFAPRTFRAVAPGDRIEAILTRGVSVRGRFIDSAGKPLPQLEARLRDEPQNIPNRFDHLYRKTSSLDVLSVSTDRDGSFDFHSLLPKVYYLSAAVGDRVVLEQRVPATSGSADLGDIVIAGVPSAILGTVQDSSSVPVPDALVWAVLAPDTGTPLLSDALSRYVPTTLSARTDAEGAFSIAVPVWRPSDLVTLFAVSKSLVPEQIGVTHPNTPVTITLRPGVDLRGQVSNVVDDAPVSGARLSIEGTSATSALPEKEALSDENGEFEIKGLPDSGELLYVVTRHKEFLESRIAVTPPFKRGAVLNVRLYPIDAIHGMVVSDNTAPVPGANLELRVDGPRRQAVEAYLTSAASDASGQFTLQPGFSIRTEGIREVVVLASHPTEGRGRAVVSIPSSREHAIVPVTITLRQEVSIHGRVISKAGEAVKNASIRLVRSGGPGPVPKGCSDTSGSFLVQDIEPGMYNVCVQAIGFAPFVSEPRMIESDEALEVTLEPPYDVTGHVVNERNAPVPDATVFALEPAEVDTRSDTVARVARGLRARRAAQSASATARTGPNGSYTFHDLPERTVTLGAHPVFPFRVMTYDLGLGLR